MYLSGLYRTFRAASSLIKVERRMIFFGNYEAEKQGNYEGRKTRKLNIQSTSYKCYALGVTKTHHV
jgi:hypothetical protein